MKRSEFYEIISKPESAYQLDKAKGFAIKKISLYVIFMDIRCFLNVERLVLA